MKVLKFTLCLQLYRIFYYILFLNVNFAYFQTTIISYDSKLGSTLFRLQLNFDLAHIDIGNSVIGSLNICVVNKLYIKLNKFYKYLQYF